MFPARKIESNPVFDHEIDWSNPLTEGLGHAVFVNNQYSVDLVTGKILKASSYGNMPDFTPDMGGAYKFTGASGNNLVEVADPITHNGVISAFAKVRNNVTNITGQFICADDHGNTSNVRVFQFRMNTSGKPEVIAFAGGVVTATGATTMTAGNEHCVGFTADHNLSSDQLRVFLNGSQDGVATLSTAIDSDASSLGIGGREDTPVVEEFDGNISIALVWTNRAAGLTNQEHQILYKNPYQILKPRKKFFIVPAAATPPTTNVLNYGRGLARGISRGMAR